MENNIPKLLQSGYYVSDSPLFTYCGTVNMNEPHINHSTIQIIRIPKSSIGLLVYNTKPMLLHEGVYTINDQNIQFLGMRDANEQVISHKPITRFRVKNGEIGLAWWRAKPLFVQVCFFYIYFNIYYSSHITSLLINILHIHQYLQIIYTYTNIYTYRTLEYMK